MSRNSRLGRPLRCRAGGGSRDRYRPNRASTRRCEPVP
ncbi:hypothetical protein A33M_1019 [Rhodovulum sp. PH10]|nr:hypothetical protein A33M_1019 [Rhodovulum sp. PH10]